MNWARMPWPWLRRRCPVRRCSQTAYEGSFLDALLDRLPNAHGERVAGSGRRRTATCDVVAVVNSKPFLIEIKATKALKFCFSGQQRKELIKAAKKSGAIPLLAVRFKRRRWVVVNLFERDCWTVHYDEKSLWELG